jgi:hypothetical protein
MLDTRTISYEAAGALAPTNSAISAIPANLPP